MKKNCRKSCEVCHKANVASQVGYRRGYKYIDIVNGDQRGVWSAPLLFGAVLYSQPAYTILKEVYPFF